MSQPHKPSQGKAVTAVMDIDTLIPLSLSPWGLEEYSSLGGHKYLLLDFEAELAFDTIESLQRMIPRLRNLPCPVIAIGSVPESLHRAVDVVVETASDSDSMIRNIIAHPIAAMTLVQLLRHNEYADSYQGLMAESLAYATLQGGRERSAAPRPDPDADKRLWQSDSPVRVNRNGSELEIVLNRPQTRNAYSALMRDGLFDALQLLRTDTSFTKGVIRGEGSCFSIGGDLNEFGSVDDAATAHAIRSSRNVGQSLFELREKLEFRLHRACIGAGIELPAFAARVVADRCTFMQLPEIKMGLLPGAGGTVSITQRIGRHRTAYMALSARKIKARTALEWGLIDAIV
ncbi:MAG: enoyl-CoA hydratase [Halioglobus sp.]|jgi:enoyl-CoA hydratase